MTAFGCGHLLTPDNLVKRGVKGGKQYWGCRQCNAAKAAAQSAVLVEQRRRRRESIKHQKRANAWKYLKEGMPL